MQVRQVESQQYPKVSTFPPTAHVRQLLLATPLHVVQSVWHDGHKFVPESQYVDPEQVFLHSVED